MDGARERWELRANVGVGPMLFGMSPVEVANALKVTGPSARIGGPYEQENYPDGVKAFYDEGQLACVALDAVTGPQVFLAGVPLAGGDWGQTQQFLLDHAAEHSNWILFTGDGSTSLADLGILIRAQRVGDAWLTRPLFVKEEWLDSQYYRDHLPLERVTD